MFDFKYYYKKYFFKLEIYKIYCVINIKICKVKKLVYFIERKYICKL